MVGLLSYFLREVGRFLSNRFYKRFHLIQCHSLSFPILFVMNWSSCAQSSGGKESRIKEVYIGLIGTICICLNVEVALDFGASRLSTKHCWPSKFGGLFICRFFDGENFKISLFQKCRYHGSRLEE